MEAVISTAFEAAKAELGERGEAWLDSGRAYGGGDPVLVLVRKRPRGRLGCYEFTDDARAVAAAGKPRGWLTAAEEVVSEFHLNVNRRGVVFVSALEHRDAVWHHALVERVAETSVAVYEALLDLDDA